MEYLGRKCQSPTLNLKQMEPDPGKEILNTDNSRDKTVRNYNRLSYIYDFITSGGESEVRRRAVEILNPSRGENILEIGTGTGKALTEIADAVCPGGRAEGIDLSPKMCAKAAKRIRKYGLSECASVKTGDFTDINISGNKYDAVFICYTLELFKTSEIPEVLMKCRSILKDGGRICIAALSRKGLPGRATRIYEWFHRQMPSIADCRPIYPEEMTARAGFDIVKSERIPLYGLLTEIVLGVKTNDNA